MFLIYYNLEVEFKKKNLTFNLFIFQNLILSSATQMKKEYETKIQEINQKYLFIYF